MKKRSDTPKVPPGIKQDYNYRAPGYTKEDELRYQQLLNQYAARYEAIRRDRSLKAHERTQQGAFLKMLNEIQSDPGKHNISIADLARVSPYSPMTTVTTADGKQRSGVDRRHTVLTDLHRLTMGSDMRDQVGESYWFDKIPGIGHLLNPHQGGDDSRTPSARAYFGLKAGRKPGETSFVDKAGTAMESLYHGMDKYMLGGLLRWQANRIYRPLLHYATDLVTDPKNASIKKSWEWGGRQNDIYNAYSENGGNYAEYTMPLLTEKGKSDVAAYRNLKRLTGTTGRVLGEAGDLSLFRGVGKAWGPSKNAVLKLFGKTPKSLPSPVNNVSLSDKIKQFGRNPWNYIKNNKLETLLNLGYIFPVYEGLVSDPYVSELNALELQRGVGNYDPAFKVSSGRNTLSDLLIAHPEIASQLSNYSVNQRTGMTNPYSGDHAGSLVHWKNMKGVNDSKLGLSPIFKYYNAVAKQNEDIADRSGRLNEMAEKVADVTPKKGRPVSLAQRNLFKSRQRAFNQAMREYNKRLDSYDRYRRDNYDNMLKGREVR